jgi:hypothetical protein
MRLARRWLLFGIGDFSVDDAGDWGARAGRLVGRLRRHSRERRCGRCGCVGELGRQRRLHDRCELLDAEGLG